MVQFGKKLLAARYDPWQDYYLDYKRLKKALKKEKQTKKNFNDQIDYDDKNNNDNSCGSISSSILLRHHFEEALDRQVEKVVLFFLEIQGQFASQLSSLKKEQSQLFTSTAVVGNENHVSMNLDVKSLTDRFNKVGQDLVQFVYFVELNTTGLRKILKKHDKMNEDHKISKKYLSSSTNRETAEDSHLQQLFHYGGISALVATIRSSLKQLRQYEKTQKQRQSPLKSSSLSQPVSSLYGSTGTTNYDTPLLDLDDTKRNEEEGVPGVIPSETLMMMSDHSVLSSDYEDRYEPILEKIDAARRRLRQSTKYVEAIAAQALIFSDSSISSDVENNMFDELAHLGDGTSPKKSKVSASSQDKNKKRNWSSWINLTSTFLYMTNYYIIAPTSGQYAQLLNLSPTMSGIIIGMTPIAALVSSILYSWWANRTYKSALLFATICSQIGNVLYASALYYDDVTMILLGRLFNGFGGARAINRRFIADTCRIEDRTAASANFVTAGALGMAAGPAIASVTGLYFSSYNNNSVSLIWTVETAPGWIMLSLWTLQLIFTYFEFQEPIRLEISINNNNNNTNNKNDITSNINTSNILKELELNNETKSLLRHNHDNNKEHAFIQDDNLASMEENYVRDEKHNNHSKEKHRKKQRNRPPLYKNVAVMSTLVIYFVLKLVLECLLSSTALVTDYYFSWHNSLSGMFLAMLGLLMFPANVALAHFSQFCSDRKIIVIALVWVFIGTFGIFSKLGNYYSPLQFCLSGICIFLSTNILEGVNMSLLSKTIPKDLAKGVFNSGFLATEAGTLGRAVGDIILSIAGDNGGMENLLENVFGPLAILTFLSTITMFKLYPHLTLSSNNY